MNCHKRLTSTWTSTWLKVFRINPEFKDFEADFQYSLWPSIFIGYVIGSPTIIKFSSGNRATSAKCMVLILKSHIDCFRLKLYNNAELGEIIIASRINFQII